MPPDRVADGVADRVADSVHIRPLEPRDFAQWLPLWQSYNTFYNRVQANDESTTRLTWGWLIDPAEPVHGLVAERPVRSAGATALVGQHLVRQRLVGMAHYILHRNTGTVGRVCYLQDLFTAADERGAGIGRQLTTAVYGAAALAGAERVYWQTDSNNAAASRLYDSVAARLDVLVYCRELP
jgi:GNAT superfamily N-acetyltransferase